MYCCPVAEYKGIAIVEVRGDKRASWYGHEYRTDGKTYLLSWEDDKTVEYLGLESERIAKEVIDEIRANPNGENCNRDWLSWREAYEVFTKESCNVEPPVWYWDEKAGHFVSADDKRKEYEAWSNWGKRS